MLLTKSILVNNLLVLPHIHGRGGRLGNVCELSFPSPKEFPYEIELSWSRVSEL